jgi:hypothetical protein
LQTYAALFARLDVVRVLYEDFFQALVRSGCMLGADDLDLVKCFQLRETWESKQYENVGSTELLFLNQARKKYAGVPI